MIESKRPLFFTFLLVLFGVAGGISGCSKSTSNVNQNQGATYVSAMNLAPYGPSVNIYINGSLSTQTPVPAGSYSNAYGPLPPGAYDIQFRTTSDSVVADIPNSDYDSLQFYTLLLYNTGINSPVKAARIVDDFTQVTVTSANYRFFNLSPDTIPVDLYMNAVPVATGRTMFDNLTPGSNYNAFQPVAPDTYNIQARIAGTSTLVGSAVGVNFNQSAAYTIFLTGSIHSPTNPLVLKVLRASY